MNKAVVVFLKSESLVNELTVSGIWVKETFVPVSAPATKVTVSNIPPFISNDVIVKELMSFGKIASPVKTVPLGCKNAALKHVISFRRHVYMFLNSQERTLEVSFRVTHGKDSFMVYASTENMRCFECGDLGHKRFACPHKNEQRVSTSCGDGDHTDHSNKAESQRAEEQDQRGQQEVSGIHVNTGSVEKPECTILPEKAVVSVANVNDNDQSDAEDLCEGSDLVQSGVSEENMADETENEEQWSDVSNRVETDLYTIDQINTILDKTKGKTGVEVSEHFPDVEKFISSVIRAKKLSSNDELSQQKRFRLNKHLTVLRTGRKISKMKGKSKK
ncbi:hypothetical protein IRJ41_014493 [Triplophysa rosa]|uniref:CCHC-type domain-containing protein n=1 Tax=Triplophysa rosa TaxID=992332 RepID=A0A9W7WCU5_TRIRA|nr:hypothetical protein IRJ41_014493 [Triplophysa rosa]